MKAVLLCLFSLPSIAFWSARAYTSEDKAARENVLTEGQAITVTAKNLSEKWPSNASIVSISKTADFLYRYLTAETSMESFWSSGGPREINAYATSLRDDNRLLKTILDPLEEAAQRLLNAVYEDLRAKLQCWINGENWSVRWRRELATHNVKAWPALTICVEVTISSKDGSPVSGYQVAGNPYSREDDRPPNCPFPEDSPYGCCLPPGYYKIWLVKDGNELLPRYVSLGLGGDIKSLRQQPEIIPFKIE